MLVLYAALFVVSVMAATERCHYCGNKGGHWPSGLIRAVVLHIALTVGGEPPAGIQVGLWIWLGVATGGGLLALYLFVLGRARLQRPDLERWEKGEEPAWESPPLAARIRGGHDQYGRGAAAPASLSGS